MTQISQEVWEQGKILKGYRWFLEINETRKFFYSGLVDILSFFFYNDNTQGKRGNISKLLTKIGAVLTNGQCGLQQEIEMLRKGQLHIHLETSLFSRNFNKKRKKLFYLLLGRIKILRNTPQPFWYRILQCVP